MLQQNISAHYDPGNSNAGKQDRRGGGDAVKLLHIHACDGNLIQPVQRSHFCEQLFHIRIIHRLLPAYGFDRIFNHLAGSIAQRCGAVEHGGDKRVVNVIKNEFRCIYFDAVVFVIICTAF